MGINEKKPSNFPSLLNYIDRLENRIERLEKHLKLDPIIFEESLEEEHSKAKAIEKSENIEFEIGQFWFAKVGVIAILTGIVFTLTLPFQGLPQILPIIIGLFITTILAGLSFLFKKSFEILSRYLLGSALIILYFSTLRFHFFSEDPVILNKTFVLSLVLIVVFINLFIAIRRKSVYLTSTILSLGFITAMLTEAAFVNFILITLFSSIIVYLKIKFQWKRLIIFGLIITYLSHLLWFINNPFLGNDFKVNYDFDVNLLFIVFYFLIYTFANFHGVKHEKESDLVIVNILINCLLSYGLFFLISVITAKETLFEYHILFSIVFIALSYLFWIKFRSKFSSFFYSILGFSALSVAIIAGFDKPDFFIILCWQSLLVLAFALLYKSRFITVANFIIYILIFLVYLGVSGFNNIPLSFGIVALMSARIINWQKERLEVQTDFIRNSYLFLAFIIFPIAIYHTVPVEFVSISWIGLSIIYYILSMLLNNIKYRWLALYTLLITAIYLLIIGIQEPDPTYKILSFISLGVVLLLISLVYSKAKVKKPAQSKK